MRGFTRKTTLGRWIGDWLRTQVDAAAYPLSWLLWHLQDETEGYIKGTNLPLHRLLYCIILSVAVSHRLHLCRKNKFTAPGASPALI